MLETLNNFFTIFGASIIVPIIIFIIAIFLHVKFSKAIMSAFYAGVGLTGFNWVIAEFTPIVTKIVRQMVNNTGIKLPVVDIGWQAGSLASFGSSVGITFFVFGLIFELIIFALGITKVFMASNLWNNFGFMIWGTLAYYVTHNFWLSLSLSFFMLLYTLVIAEIQADRWSEYFEIKNATVASLHNIEQTIPAILLDPLWNLLGFNKVKSLVLLLVIFIVNLGNLIFLSDIDALVVLFNFEIQLDDFMTIFPLITDVFAKAFIPLADAIDSRQKEEMKEKTHPKRWFLGIDDGVGYGEPATIISGMILIPIMVLLAFVLPGNRTLPVVDLIALPFMVESIVAITRGNILKIIANGIIWFSLGLYASSWLGSVYTEAVSNYGATIPTGVVLITSFNLMARPLNAVVFAAFISQNPFWIGLCLVTYLVLLFLLRRYRSQIWSYLRKMSEKNIN